MHRFFSSALFLLCLSACSKSSNVGSVDNDTESASAPSDAGTAVETAAGLITNAACEAQISYEQRCADTPEAKSAACANGRKVDCDRVTTSFSSAYREAVATCVTATVPCGDAEACVDKKLAGTTPTAIMAQIRDNFCATCKDTGPTCKDTFFRISSDEGNGDGYLILLASDDVARAIDAQCTGSKLDIAGSGATTCREAFLNCATNEQQSALPPFPDACYPPPPDGG